jgi:hypothetical protein
LPLKEIGKEFKLRKYWELIDKGKNDDSCKGG